MDNRHSTDLKEKNAAVDKLLISDFLAGNERAYEQVINKYQTLVYTLAMHLTASEEDSAEVVKEVFVAINRDLRTQFSKEYSTDTSNDFNQSFELLLHRYTYDISLAKLLDCRLLSRSIMLSTSESTNPEDYTNDVRTTAKVMGIGAHSSKIDELTEYYSDGTIEEDICMSAETGLFEEGDYEIADRFRQ